MDERESPAGTNESKRPTPSRQGIMIILLAIAGLLVTARVAVMLFYPSATPPATIPEANSQTLPATATLTPTRVPPSPTLTWTPQPTPTPAPSATPEPLRLAVEESVLEAYQTYFASLPSRYEGLALLPYAGPQEDEALPVPLEADWGIYWASHAPWEAVPLREEPYALIVHPASAQEGFTLAQLAALAEGEDQTLTLVVGDGGRAARELLGLEGLAPNAVQVSDWTAAKEYVATHEDAWALVPWEAVDFRVKVLPVEGQRLDPEKPQGYPLLRRLWLSGNTPPPQSLLEDLRKALRYELPATVELVAVGDIMLDRNLTELIQQHSPRYPFEGQGIQPLLAGADITIGNLECAISERGTRQTKTYTFRAEPQVVEGLVYAGFDVLSLANNHTGDFGDEALLDTLGLLREALIAPIGAGENITVAHEAKIIEANGLRLAFLAYNQIQPTSFAATATSPGSAFMDKERMVADVRAARQQADVVVVQCHWGTEYSSTPNASQKELAQALADAGAALILGHHPHVVQGLSYGQRTLTAYSLGNFIFDFDKDYSRETSSGAVLRCLIGHAGVKMVEWLPYSIVDYRPVLVSAEEGARTLETIIQVTQKQGAFPKEEVGP